MMQGKGGHIIGMALQGKSYMMEETTETNMDSSTEVRH